MEEGKIVIKVGGEEYFVKTPFTFRFWQWLWKQIGGENPEEIGEKIIEESPAIISHLTGLSEDEILQKQTEEEMVKAIAEITEQITKEVKESPFARKALLLSTARELAKKTAKEMKMNSGGN
jgi:hypothetical protein